MVEKNKEYIVDIIDYGYQGEGIAKINGFTIFIPKAIKGEKVRILIVKVLKTHAFGKVLEILMSSPYRVEEDCSVFGKCGGCDLRHITYEETLNIKQKTVENCLQKELGRSVIVEGTLGMENPREYRNKLQYPFGIDREGKPVMGVFSERSHDIVQVKECNIQNKVAQEIAEDLYQFVLQNKLPVYQEKTRKGIFRHVVIKARLLYQRSNGCISSKPKRNSKRKRTSEVSFRKTQRD